MKTINIQLGYLLGIFLSILLVGLGGLIASCVCSIPIDYIFRKCIESCVYRTKLFSILLLIGFIGSCAVLIINKFVKEK